MRKLIAVLFLFCGAIVHGQVVPQGINYQAVALDQQGQPIPGVDIVGRPIDDAEIGVRISILEASPTGNVLYQEEHEVLTDQYGMFNLTIGQGLQVSADAFNTINWQGDKFLQVELSIENDGEFTLSAVQQLMSVPYAFLADKALNVDDADADPTNELQALSISNDTLYLSSGGYVVLPSDQINDADADPTNELQAISMSNDTLYLSSGGFVVLPPDQINDADADPTNEFQTITRNGSTINLSGNGGSVTVFDGDYTNLTNTPTIPSKTSDLVNDSGFLTSEVDGSTTNEIQTLSKSGSTISLSDNGGSVTVFDGDYNNLSNTPSIPTSTSDLTNDSGFITTEVDGSTTNEIQTLSKSGSTISLSDNGGSVTVFDGDYNNLSNSPSIPTNTSDLTNDSGFLTSEVDGSTTNEIQTLSKAGSTISLSNNGGSVTVFDGDYNNLSNTPSIPTNTSDLTNDSGFLISEVDGSTTNEIQILSISNDTIFLSGGGFVKLPASQGFDGDYNSLTNTPFIPTLTSDLTNDSGFLTSEVDGSTTNEIQTLSKSGSTISLSDNGGSVTVFDGDYNNLSNTPTIPTSTSDLINDSGFLTSELDSSTTNEIQTLVLSNDTLLLTKGGGEVYLSSNGNSTLSIQEKLDNGITPWQLLNDGVLKSSLYGKFYQGGIIIYLNDSTLSGMVITDFNVKSNVCPPSNYTGNATSEEIGDGLSNSAAISWPNATGACLSLVSNGYDDWFLPSIKELLNAPQNVPGWVGGEFWSSTVTTSGFFKIIQGNSVGNAGSNFCYPEVRAVRVFSNANTQSNLTFSLSVDDDLDSTNELQTLSISSDTVFLSNGGFIKLPNSNNSSGSFQNNEINTVFDFPTTNIDTGAFYYNAASDEIAVFIYSANSTPTVQQGGSASVYDGFYNSYLSYSFASFKASTNFFLTEWQFTGGGNGNFSYTIIKDSDWNVSNGDLGTIYSANASGTTIAPMRLIEKDRIYHIGIRQVSSSGSVVPLNFTTNFSNFTVISEFQRGGVTGKFWPSKFTFKTYGYSWRVL